MLNPTWRWTFWKKWPVWAKLAILIWQISCMYYILIYSTWNIDQIHAKFDHGDLKKLIIENCEKCEFLSTGVSMVWQSRRIRQNPENCSNFNMEWVTFIRLHKIIKKFCITFSLLNSLDFISRQHWNPKSHCVPLLMEMNGEENLRGRENDSTFQTHD